MSPGEGISFCRHERVCSVDRNSSGADCTKAQTSTTCDPFGIDNSKTFACREGYMAAVTACNVEIFQNTHAVRITICWPKPIGEYRRLPF